MLADPKSPLSSLTIKAALLGLVLQIMDMLGVPIAPETAREIGVQLNNLLSAVLFAIAIYGRWRATRAVSTKA